MKSKFTLTIDKEVIEQSKKFAKNNQISLSELIENYLKFLIKHQKEPNDISPKIKKLRGSIKLPEGLDTKPALSNSFAYKYKL